jgi:CBS domain-containing protein
MAKFIHEIMNKEVYSVRPSATIEQARKALLSLKISGAPVVDAYGVAVGMIGLKDVMANEGGATVAERMHVPVLSVPTHDLISDVAKIMGEFNLHRTVVVDGNGNIVGIVSLLDLIRALVGLPASHPPTFAHFDQETQLVWSDDQTFSAKHLEHTPHKAGVLCLVVGTSGTQEQIIWAEATNHLYDRLHNMLEDPDKVFPHLTQLIRLNHVRFRTAIAPDVSQRMRALKVVLTHTD